MSAYNTLVNGPNPVLVDFTAEWCGPCKTMAPELKKLAAELGDKLKIIKIDIDKNPDLASKLQVRSVPTLILYKEGKQVWRQSGAMMAHQLKPLITSFM